MGTRIHIGWSVLELRKDVAGGLVVCEPAFSGDPISQVVDTVSQTLAVLAWQNDVLARLGLTGTAIRFDQTIVADPRAFDEPRVFLERGDPSGDESTGWYLGSDNAPSSERIRVIRMYELLSLRPGALKVMPLPPGTMVIMEGDSILSVKDGSDRELWAG